jgi:hypothetical protein
VDDHVRVTACPAAVVALLAVREAVGADDAEPPPPPHPPSNSSSDMIVALCFDVVMPASDAVIGRTFTKFSTTFSFFFFL